MSRSGYNSRDTIFDDRATITSVHACTDVMSLHYRDTMIGIHMIGITTVLCRQRSRLANRWTGVVLVYWAQSGYIFWSVMDEYINMYGDEKLSLDVTSDCCSCKCSRRRRRREEEEEEGGGRKEGINSFTYGH